MDKKEILEGLANKPLYELDKMRDEIQLDLKEVLHNLYLAKDEELIIKHDKRRKLLGEGNSYSKVENMLRSDEELYLLKRKVMALSERKKQTLIQHNMINDYYWKARR